MSPQVVHEKGVGPAACPVVDGLDGADNVLLLHRFLGDQECLEALLLTDADYSVEGLYLHAFLLDHLVAVLAGPSLAGGSIGFEHSLIEEDYLAAMASCC